ncbi:MAG: cobyrinic acid ac-diamide synthase [Acidimicrobiaceae bacterium]|jgi:chromosome partitioning protein|nr:cobyrinic acid ac-diamide synthase [Acidimicrobiaceae bacterium]
MRTVIAVTNVKGGVGKTTSAVYLAGAAVRSGRGPVLLVDADPQASSAEWLEEAPVSGVRLMEAPTARMVTRAMEAGSERIVIVDSPPGDEKTVRAVLERADAVVIPTRVGGPEPSRVRATLDMIAPGTRRGIVICAARTGTRDLDDTLRYWDDEGEAIWGVVPERVAIAAASGAPLSIVGLVHYENVLIESLERSRKRAAAR